MTILKVSGLGKRYTVRPERSIALGFVRKYRPHSFWALRGLDVELAAGEILGVIGRNGAGKSTLLKLAVGVSHPTEGSIVRPKRIAPLIEVGAGFHPELTGRENVLVNGRLLGLSSRQVAQRFDEIVGFAQLEHAIDQPVKQYSSGMFMRLGFAVAINTEPEMLVVDEVLAVGDLSFQMRCVERITKMRDEGVGILFVSHNLGSVQDVADRCILLDKGRLVEEGEPTHVIGLYHRMVSEAASREGEIGATDITGELAVVGVSVTDEQGNERNLWQPGDRLTATITYEATADIPGGHVGMQLVREGAGVVSNWNGQDTPLGPMRKGERVQVTLSFALHLVHGTYALHLGVSRLTGPGLLGGKAGAARIAVGQKRGSSGIVELHPSLAIAHVD
jgi:lipopolysaccharide transport system ATP-binding protein